ncbi:hypothetical protein F5884DRAFT_750719 [Xylogone sp. PMI_703]|nr:hypothetical protein F5884DRAFT_750719 [Xylogone sp. PMI_703]
MPSIATIILTSLLFVDVLSASALEKKSLNDDMNNCPGVWHMAASTTGCCVGGVAPTPYLSVCEGWPICRGPVTTTYTAPPLSCATFVTEASDYPEVISKVKESLSASGTNIRTTLPNIFGDAARTPAPSTKSAQAFAGLSNSSPTTTPTKPVKAVTSSSSTGGAPQWTGRIGLAGAPLLAAAML